MRDCQGQQHYGLHSSLSTSEEMKEHLSECSSGHLMGNHHHDEHCVRARRGHDGRLPRGDLFCIPGAVAVSRTRETPPPASSLWKPDWGALERGAAASHMPTETWHHLRTTRGGHQRAPRLRSRGYVCMVEADQPALLSWAARSSA